MLKSKDAYANESAYVRAFFLHNSHVTDFPIDPVLGSLVRVIHPREDQPKTDKGWFNRPQFIFISKAGCSRMHELEDAKDMLSVFKHIRERKISIEDILNEFPRARGTIGVMNGSEITFRASTNGICQLVRNFSSLRQNRTGMDEAAALYNETIDNLIDSFDRIVEGVGPKSDIMTIGRDSMMTLQRSDYGVRDPIIITARQPTNVGAHYLIMHSRKERLCFQLSKGVSLVETINKFFGTVASTAHEVEAYGRDIITFVNELDINMEYVSARYVDYDSGRHLRVVMNSDRFPANTKFSYMYNHSDHVQMHGKIREFAKMMEQNFNA